MVMVEGSFEEVLGCGELVLEWKRWEVEKEQV
jgi:hypothetical protein